MIKCQDTVCANCTCGRRVRLEQRSVRAMVANANFKHEEKPTRVIRRDPLEAAARLEVRLKESMQILA